MERTNIVAWHKRRMKRLKIEEMATLDAREVPRYWIGEVSVFTGVPVSTLKRWIGQISNSSALIHPPADELQQHSREARLSFANLLEVHILDAARQRDIPVSRIRDGLDYLRTTTNVSTEHPLLAYEFYSVHGIQSMFIRALQGQPVNVSRYGQLGLGEVLNDRLKRIEWDKTGPVRLMPMRSEHVVIDLHVSGGQPVVKGTGVLATMLAGRWRAGDTYEELATGYNLRLEDVREAVRYIDAA